MELIGYTAPRYLAGIVQRRGGFLTPLFGSSNEPHVASGGRVVESFWAVAVTPGAILPVPAGALAPSLNVGEPMTFAFESMYGEIRFGNAESIGAFVRQEFPKFDALPFTQTEMAHFLADDGEKIHVKISGEGPPMVLLHGWTSSHRDWNPFLAAFEPAHRVFRWDARGHGGHHLETASPPSVTRMARDLQNLLDHHQLDRVVVAGHSMGALTLWQYLRDFGDSRLAKLIFIDQSPRLVTDAGWPNGVYGDFDAARNARFIDDLEADFAEAVLRLVAYGHNDRARQLYEENGPGIQSARQRLASFDARALIDCWKTLTAADFRDVLPTIGVPALLVYGGASNFYSTATAHYVRDHIPDARLHIYPDVDHAPHLWERERFVRDVLDFVAG